MNEQPQQPNEKEERPTPAPGTQQPMGQDSSEATNDGVFGPWIGAAVIVVVVIVGGFYFWGSDLAGNIFPQEEMSADEIRNQPDPALESLRSQSPSNELDAIERDLESTDLDSFEADLQQIDEELGN